MTYKVGIVGCGVIGTRLGQAFQEYEGTIIKSACDINKEQLRKYTSKFGCTGYQNFQNMIDSENLDILYVGVPPKYHFDIVKFGIQNGINVICEKPITIQASEAYELVQLAEESSVITAINLPLRYNSAVKKMKKMIFGRELGDVRKILMKFRFPRWPRSWQDVDWLKTSEQGGPIREIGTHFIFLLKELFDQPKLTHVLTRRYKSDQAENSVTGMFMVNEIPGIIDLECEIPQEEENSLEVIGTEKRIIFTEWRKLLLLTQDNKGELLEQSNSNSSLILIDEFTKAIKKKSHDLVSFKTAAEVQEFVDSILY